MTVADKELEALCINTIRTLSIDAVQKANSGHPGLPMGAAPMAYVLWQKHLRHSPSNPHWVNRDRFVLSAGHGSMLLYSLLHLTGYDLTLDDIKNFRQWESRTPGHPEFGVTAGVEATTGPLGQGTANAVGMAIAERVLASRFNKPGYEIINHRTYAIVSDGDMMEGISGEAASLAGHLKLGKLIYLYDSNHISLDGPTSMAFTEDVGARYRAYGWQVLEVKDGNTDITGLNAALAAAEADTEHPSMIVVTTTIGYGSPNKQGKADAHGSPLGVEEVKLAKHALGWPTEETFFLPENALARFREAVPRGKALESAWNKRFDAYRAEFPELATQLDQALRGELPADWDADLPIFGAADAQATRQASGKALNAIAKRVPFFMGGDADLSVSTTTSIKDGGSFDGSGPGRNLHFGVREHAMGAIANGMAYHGGIRPFVSTFFVFSDYMRPAVRLAALNHLPVLCVWTHDSIAVGEDGPTHEPIEHLMSFRIMPNFTLIRPGDPTETTEAWRWAMQHKTGPVGLIMSRQKLAVIDRTKYAPAAMAAKGAYVLADAPGDTPKVILIATGSEVHLAIEAFEKLVAAGTKVRVVSMPSWEIFARQSPEYRESVLPTTVRARVSIEAGTTVGWERWIGLDGIAIGIDRYGASAPGELNLSNFGFTTEAVIAAARKLLA